MKAIKKISIILIILFITSVSGSVFAEDMNMDITYDVPSQANESETNSNEKENRESYSMEEGKKAENPEESTEQAPKMARAAAVNNFNVCRAYGSKKKSSDKNATVTSFQTLKSFPSFDSAMSYMNSQYNTYNSQNKSSYANGLCITNKSGKIIAMKKGRAFATPSGATMNIGSTYITSNHELYYYSAKANTSTQASVNVGISGETGYVSSSNLTLIPETVILQVYKSANSGGRRYNRSYYSRNSAGELVHTYYTISSAGGQTGDGISFVVDKAPSFMKAGTRYYSMNGYDFYTGAYLTGKAGTYHPYFKNLPYRTKSHYSASQFDSRIKSYSSKSILRGCGKDLITAQNTYGINALLELSFANLESAYGTSGYAISRKNLFGIAATDSNPDGATYFKSAGDCIIRHASRYLSQGYFDAETDSRYFGTSPGSKDIGVNVKYASDPYHGEKISGIAYTQDKNMGSRDYGVYTIGKTKTAAYIYKKASTSGGSFHRLGTKGSSAPAGMTVAIIGTSGNYYKVQTDMGVVKNSANYKNKYDFASSVGYVQKSQVTVIREGSGNIPSSKPSSSGSNSNASSGSKPSTSSKLSLGISKMAVRPYTSYGFVPGYKNNMTFSCYAKTNKKNTKYEVRIYNSKKKRLKVISKTINKSGNVTISWNGKIGSRYLSRSSKGTKYYVRLYVKNGSKYVTSPLYSFKAYNTATSMKANITRTTIKAGESTVMACYPNRPGTSFIRVYTLGGSCVADYSFTNKSSGARRAASFKGYGNYGKYKNKKLKGTYKVRFIHGSYKYTYTKRLIIK
ncbi:glucosaminidase domain-containing protein [Anaerofustis stercorihominis]|uniref:glucosaminidase domain-containing protein n=1 Tax=Anaerofustis stercorihominis TaxID=214853 RepID=UPI00214CEC5A|nr:glucosaminidase domain-containing protein [Anaerofustis stercorihominis]MCR2033643.1 glucosaminidase domain-containing protein [Anaerofustis stercorihominis]